MFCGAKVRFAITDTFVDQIQANGPARACIDRIMTGFDTLLSCPSAAGI